MSRMLKYIFFSILVLFTLSAQNFSFSQEEEVREIQNLLDHGEYDKAFDLAMESAVKFENVPIFLYSASFAALLKKDYDTALEIIDIYDKKKPNSIGTSHLKVHLYSDLEKHTEVIYNANKLIEYDFAESEIFYLRGLAYYNIKQFDLAKNDFEKTIELEDIRIEPYFYLGIIYFLNDEFDNALNYLQVTKKHSKNSLDPYFFSGSSYYAKQQFSNALEDLLYYIQPIENNSDLVRSESGLNENKAITYRAIGHCYLELEEYDKAKEYLNTSLTIAEHPLAHYYLGLIYLEKENMEKTLFHFENLSKYRIDAVFFLEYARVLYMLEYEDSVIREQMNIMNDLPSNIANPTYFYKEAGTLNIVMQDTVTAINHFIKYLEHNPSDKDLSIFLEEEFQKNPKRYMNQWLEYTEMLKKSTKDIRKKAYFTAFKSVIYIQNEMYEEALEQINIALRLHHFGEYFIQRALILFALNTDMENNGTDPAAFQQINQDLNKAIEIGLRLEDVYKIKAVVELINNQQKEACKSIRKYKKMGGNLEDCQFAFICKGQEDDNCQDLDFYFVLSPFQERFSD